MRLTKQEYFMELATIASKRSTCNKLAVWAVLVKDDILISTWYNWSARWEISCLDIGCLISHWWNCIRTIHSEVNCILNAARIWVSIKWATMYVTDKPCSSCSRAIINAWISKVYYRNHYEWDKSIDLSKYIKVAQM